MSPRARRAAWFGLWLVLAVPALWQIGLLIHAVGGRFGYPYDLEWMEGGLLQHAQRISDSQGIYVAPSVDFIPYLYTPLYPGLVAFVGGAVGISYQLGRAISIVSLLGIVAITIGAIVRWRPRVLARFSVTRRAVTAPSMSPDRSEVGKGPRWVGAALALGVFAACYPFVDGWYDLVRADTMSLFLITAGVLACSRWSRAGVGGNGDALMMAAATILVLAFFTKQTAVIYVVWGGVVIVASWVPQLGKRRGIVDALRRVGFYTLTAAVLGIGGVMLLDRITHGWFWTYVFKIHQAHDFNMDRFWASFGHVLWHFPALTVVIVGTLIAVSVTAIVRPAHDRRLPEASGAFLLWTATYAVSTVVGAIGWGTEFAHFNAYMPALLHGALAVGAAVPALAGCASAWTAGRRYSPYATVGAAAAVMVAGGITLLGARWEPKKYIPREADRAAGAALVKRIAAIDGDVWVPSHPWYGHLAGKRMFVHRMGVKDVTWRQRRQVAGLDRALRDHRFAAIVLDHHDIHLELSGFTAQYRTDVALPGTERPRIYAGAGLASFNVVPEAVWIPAVKEKPPFGVKVLFDFEPGSWDGWEIHGTAWGRMPASGAVQGQAVVGGFGGRFFATSMRGGENATGSLTSTPFVIDGHKISLRIGGGIGDKLRVELRVDGHVVRRAIAEQPVGERLVEVSWDVSDWFQLTGQLVAIDDDDTASWAHLNVDEIWLWP